MIRLHQVKCASDKPSDIEAQILKKLHIQKKDLFAWEIVRKSIDARKQKVFFSYIIDVSVRREKRFMHQKDVTEVPDTTYRFPQPGNHNLTNRPVVVGFGPAGMFAALILAQAGYCPLIIERGSKVERRKDVVEHFWHTGQLDPSCNVQFGEGGAGAFSDGKLTTRSKDKRCQKVLDQLIEFGARKTIKTDQYPHIGSDAFLDIIRQCRKTIEQAGGTFCFDSQCTDIKIKENKLQAICVDGRWIDCQACILAIGHSAKDTIYMLHEKGIRLTGKRFAVGVRIEHKQAFIDRAMLKDACINPHLVPARYKLTYMASNKKGVYSFCMCPGGYVICASSEEGKTVVNGMSYAARDGENANSALLVQVDPQDYGSALFDGLHYQEQLESRAYQMAAGYKACTQLARDYLAHQVSTAFDQVQPTYALGTTFTDLNDLFSPAVNQALHEALENFEKKVPGFVSEGAILTAVESRSSSSIRIERDEQGMTNVRGIFPCGEGSGYAGGIVTSAVDGIRSAEKLIEYFSCPQYNKSR
ncbi:MAG: hypothetical protein J6D36_04155 [Erysipelotrichaceae bacterium]|nr:hypothetical protein [Erysipelotrichaceae bacterium]